MAKQDEWKDFDSEELAYICKCRGIAVTEEDTRETLTEKLSPKPVKKAKPK